MRISDWSSDVCSSDLECDGAHEVFGLSDATELDFGEDAVAEGCVLEEGFGEGCFDEGGGDGVGPDAMGGEVEGDGLVHALERPFGGAVERAVRGADRPEEHTSELQSLMRISYAVF